MKSPRLQKKKPEEINRTPLKEIELSAEDWEEFDRGITLFNNGEFWHAHEAWELVWLRHTEDERLFFQGVIQLAAAYHQLTTKGNLRGMMNNFDKAYSKLEVFQPEYLGLGVTPLLRFIEQGKKEVERLDEGDLTQFNVNLIPKLQFHKPFNPDTIVGLRGVLESERFWEGAKLFNDGYYWEAHEVWEDVWREQEGDAKTFAQAFVQMAAAYSFMKLSKFESAKYLFGKAIEKFHHYENLDCGLPISVFTEGMRLALQYLNVHPHNGSSSFKFSAVPAIPFPKEE